MHSQEPSYYEIALTNRQVLGFFVVLLLCVVGAFFSGIWLGRKQPGEGPQVAQVESLAAESEESEEPLQELNFFTDEQPTAATPEAPAPRPERKAQVSPAAVGREETTLAEDLASVEESQPPAQSPESSPASSGATGPVAVESEPAPVARTGFVLQVFSSPNRRSAEQLLEQLRGDGYAVFLVEEIVNGRATHRVHIGPFAERSEADRLKPVVAKAYKVEPFVTRIQ
jgi:cell division septation protein DedD